MVGLRESEQVPGDGEGQESLACCSPWGQKESDMTEKLNKISQICQDSPFITFLPMQLVFHDPLFQ